MPAHSAVGPSSGLAGMPEQPAPGLRWRRILPGEEREIGQLRRWLARLLPDCPARDDVISVATELSANAVRHTASGQGGCFGIEVTCHGTVIRVAVADRGAPTEPRLIDDPMEEYGRGLMLVHGLSVRTGVRGGERGRLVWADIPWHAGVPAAPAAPSQQRQAAAG